MPFVGGLVSLEFRKNLLLDHGRNKEGKLWVAYQLNKTALRSGVVTIPGRLKTLLGNKAWKMVLDENREINIGSTISNIYGLKPFLNAENAEEDDYLILEFSTPGIISASLMDRENYEEQIDAV